MLRELVELHRLRIEDPHLNLMSGHDADALGRFLKSGLLVRGFHDAPEEHSERRAHPFEVAWNFV